MQTQPKKATMGGEPQAGLSPGRRAALRGLAAAALLAPAAAARGARAEGAAAAAAPPPPPPPPPLCAALSEATAAGNPGVGWALLKRDKQLRYPPWMEGTWAVAAKFAGAEFPLGPRVVGRATPGALKASMAVALPDVGAGMERALAFEQRVFNTRQVMDAFLGYAAVTAVTYAPLDNPTRMAVVWATPRKDAERQSSDLRKAEIFINNRGAAGGGGGEPFCCFEQQVTQAKQQGAIGDYAVWWEFRPEGAGGGEGGAAPRRLAVRQRVAAYLQPQDPLYFQAGSRAVAVYDYAYTYTRV
ncbi:MAG: hypothetical protein J3K34DRAFT_523389 [Monoraphidium minutum]|nr:MAG: hypothetical protein J3K34DRAFT_523389 [Monoraphidium minutum]